MSHDAPPIDPFDPDNLRIDANQVAAAAYPKASGATKRAKRQLSEKLFAVCPLGFTSRALAAINNPRAIVLLYLLHNLRLRGEPVPVSHKALSALGVSRKVKDRTLGELEKAGLISVTRRRGRCPSVTFLVEVYQ
jgi:hypothetical protein